MLQNCSLQNQLSSASTVSSHLQQPEGKDERERSLSEREAIRLSVRGILGEPSCRAEKTLTKASSSPDLSTDAVAFSQCDEGVAASLAVLFPSSTFSPPVALVSSACVCSSVFPGPSHSLLMRLHSH